MFNFNFQHECRRLHPTYLVSTYKLLAFQIASIHSFLGYSFFCKYTPYRAYPREVVTSYTVVYVRLLNST